MRPKRTIALALLSFFVGTALAQNNTDSPFNGIVTDVVGQPLKGVKVWTTDKRRYAKSDKQGRFGLTNVLPTDTLHLEYKSTRYDILVDGKKSARVHLANEVSIEEDQELIDMGYGYVKKRECMLSRGGISGAELVRTGQTNLIEALQGKVAGLYVSNGRALIRGIGTIHGSTEPLYLLNGVEVPNFDMVNLYDVDYVEVMKDASIYGARGANGAIIVKTKR